MKFTTLSFMLGLYCYSLISPIHTSAQNSTPCPQNYNRLLQSAQSENRKSKYVKAIRLLGKAEDCDPSQKKAVHNERVKFVQQWEQRHKRVKTISRQNQKVIQKLEGEKEKLVKQKTAVERSSFEARKRELDALELVVKEKKQRLVAEKQKMVADSLKGLVTYEQIETQKKYLKTQAKLLLQQGKIGESFRLAEYLRQQGHITEADFLLNQIYYYGSFQIDSLHFSAPFYRMLGDFAHPIRETQFSPDNTQILLTFEGNRFAKILQQRSKKEYIIEGHTAPIVAGRYSPDGEYIFTASLDSTIKIWNRNAQYLADFKEKLGSLQDMQITSNGQYLLTASYGQAKIWNSVGTPLLSLPIPNQQVHKVAWSHNQEYILIHYANDIEIWQRKGKKLRYKPILSKHFTTQFNTFQFSADDRFILAAANDGTTRIWEITSKGLQGKAVLKKHKGAVNSAFFSADNRFIITSSNDQSAYVWRWDTGLGLASEIHHLKLQELGDAMHTARLSSDNKQIITASKGGQVKIWNWQSKPIRFFEGVYNKSVLSPTKHLFSNVKGAQIQILSFQNEVEVAWQHGQNSINNLHFSNDNQFLLSTGQDSTLKVWDWQRQLLVDSLKINDSKLFATFAPNNANLIAIASNQGHIRLYNRKHKKFENILGAHQGVIHSIHFSPDGKHLLSSSADKTATIWEVETGQKVLMLQGHASAVLHARFSPNGQYIVTASHDRMAKIWEVNDSKVVSLEYKGHTAGLLDARFIGDEGHVMTTSLDGLMKVWEKNGKLIHTIQHNYPIIAAVPSFDGEYLFTYTEKGMFVKWLDGQKIIDEADRLGVPQLSAKEKTWYGLEVNELDTAIGQK